MNNKPKIIAVLIAYKAEKTLKEFWNNFPRKYFDEIILVDDASGDKTFEIAKKLQGLKAYKNPVSLGYGGNLKVCLSKALAEKADIIVEIHPDNEYDLASLPLALNEIKKDADLVLGNRFAKGLNPVKSGMRIWKYYPTRILTIISNIILGTNFSDLHQGFRVYTKKLLQETNFKNNSNNYLFSFEIIAQAVFFNFKISQVPVRVRYQGAKRGASFKNSFLYTLGVFKVLFFYLMSKLGIKAYCFKN